VIGGCEIELHELLLGSEWCWGFFEYGFVVVMVILFLSFWIFCYFYRVFTDLYDCLRFM